MKTLRSAWTFVRITFFLVLSIFCVLFVFGAIGAAFGDRINLLLDVGVPQWAVSLLQYLGINVANMWSATVPESPGEFADMRNKVEAISGLGSVFTDWGIWIGIFGLAFASLVFFRRDEIFGWIKNTLTDGQFNFNDFLFWGGIALVGILIFYVITGQIASMGFEQYSLSLVYVVVLAAIVLLVVAKWADVKAAVLYLVGAAVAVILGAPFVAGLLGGPSASEYIRGMGDLWQPFSYVADAGSGLKNVLFVQYPAAGTVALVILLIAVLAMVLRMRNNNAEIEEE